jgi:hypothetical protein
MSAPATPISCGRSSVKLSTRPAGA